MLLLHCLIIYLNPSYHPGPAVKLAACGACGSQVPIEPGINSNFGLVHARSLSGQQVHHIATGLIPGYFEPSISNSLIPGPLGADISVNLIGPGISSSCACVWISFNLLYTTTRSCPNKLETIN